MDARRQQHHGGAMQPQQFPPLLHPQGGGGHHPPPRLPLPLPHPHMGFGPRPNSFSGPGYPLAGQKRSIRSSDGGGVTKLFVASLPRNISEDEVRGLFDEFGNVLEVIFLKDKKTGLPQGCCFIKYGSLMEAERAIRALDNQRTLAGGPAPLQVKLSDGERDHPGPMEHKLFVGSLSKQATEQEIEEIFAPYGHVENVYIIRDEQKRSRGCAFVSFPERDMAIAAISVLNGVYRMPGCHQPIIVRFADPKRPRSEDKERSRGGPNYSPRSHHGGSGPNYQGGSNYQGPGGGLRSSGGPAMDAHGPPFGWRQSGGANGMGLIPQAGILPLGAPAARRGPMEGPNAAMGVRGGSGPSLQAAPAVAGQVPILAMGPQQLSQQQGFKELPLHKPGQAYGQQHSLHPQPLQHSVPSTPQLNQGQQPMQGFPLTPSPDTRSQQHVPAGQYSSGQPPLQAYGQTPAISHQLQHQVPSSMQQPMPTMASQQLQYQPLHHQQDQDSHQKHMVQTPQQVHQGFPLQPSHSVSQPQAIPKETSQQALLQPQMTSQGGQQQPSSLQPSWAAPLLQQAVPSMVAPSVVTTTVASVSATPGPATCAWTEHVSPEGHKYYYNSSTGESRWEKPEEFAKFEQQQQVQASYPQQQHLSQHQLQPQLQQQQPQLQQQQLVQVQAQAHTQQLQPQYSNLQYQQPALLSHQPSQQTVPQQVQPHYQHQAQPLTQQQPQLQQLSQQAHLQQLQPQIQQTPQSQPLMQQPQYSASGMQFAQGTVGGPYQGAQGYGQLQPSNAIVDASRAAPLKHFVPGQQIPAANGVPDAAAIAATRGATQWMPAMQQQQQQQGLSNQDWTWKSKPAGS